MIPKSTLCLIFALFAVTLFIACGDSDEDSEELVVESTTQPQAEPQGETEDTVSLAEIDFAREEAEIREVIANKAEAVGTKEPDEIMPFWLKSESLDVFTSWVFWAGAFEKNEGWKGIKNGWAGIFALLGGEMTIDISSIEIDPRAKHARVRGAYTWAASGDLIAAMQKDKGNWFIRAIDYTNERFGDQIEPLGKVGHTNP